MKLPNKLNARDVVFAFGYNVLATRTTSRFKCAVCFHAS